MANEEISLVAFYYCLVRTHDSACTALFANYHVIHQINGECSGSDTHLFSNLIITFSRIRIPAHMIMY